MSFSASKTVEPATAEPLFGWLPPDIAARERGVDRPNAGAEVLLSSTIRAIASRGDYGFREPGESALERLISVIGSVSQPSAGVVVRLFDPVGHLEQPD
ncbi:hypothetical protein [Amycolatopsis sp. DG1A-15b]|uniref:hypothetical protein n=1 Tax=Amycolatopsis sp. DG1A-15b TaxID=3052846 RepID=UPI00255BE7EE|nr:hypothetical protein [Amycolatopsis sp. DG1A-15b]WIX91358.1 hypothetical protein QRY02_13270 [Amycolatopsis sp. DG1A-15b]